MPDSGKANPTTPTGTPMLGLPAKPADAAAKLPPELIPGSRPRVFGISIDRLLPEWFTFLLVLAIAAALRIYRIDAIPPGLNSDEGIYGFFATQVMAGDRPIFFPLPDGREPLFIYTVALAFSVSGTSAVVLRLVAVAYGLLTVAATYLFTRELCGRRIATLATFVLAITYWHVHLSRLGYRVGTVPLFICIAVYFLWRGVRRAELWSYAASGAAVGISLYTYISARVVPFWLGFYALLLFIPLWRRGISARRHLIGVVLFACAALTVFAPLGDYFLRHPEALSVRTSAVGLSVSSENPMAEVEDYGTNVLRTVGLFVVQGDTQIRHNLPGRPAFTEFTALAFVIGLALALRYFYKPKYFLLLLWVAAMLLPGVLSSDAPHFLRTSGTLPAACVLVAIGIDALWRLVARPKVRVLAIVAPVLILAGLALSLRSTAYDYFVHWASLSDVTYAFNADETDADCLARQLSASGPSLVASPPLISTFITQHTCSVSGEPARWFDGQRSLIIPHDAAGSTLSYVYSRFYTPSDGRHCELIPCLAPYARVADLGGGTAVVAYQVPGDPGRWARPAQPLVARIGGNLEVLGYSLERRFVPGNTVRLTLFTRVASVDMPPGDWKLFANLLFVDDGKNRAGAVGEPLMPASWQPGDIYIAWLDIPTTDAIDAGLYRIEIGAFDNDSYRRQPVVDGQGHDIGNALIIEPLRAVAPTAIGPTLVPANPIARLGESIELLGYDLSQELRPDGSGEMALILRWRGQTTMSTSYTVFVQLLDSSGRLVGQSDVVPGEGNLPTTVWATGEVVNDRHRVPIAPALRGQKLRLIVGMYESQSQKRLPVTGPDSQPAGDYVELTTISVR